jgi:hypothetical protein
MDKKEAFTKHAMEDLDIFGEEINLLTPTAD